MCAAIDHSVAHDATRVPAGGAKDLLATDATDVGARGAERVIAATLLRSTVLCVQVVQTTIVGATTDIYAVPSTLERAHNRMHAMLDIYEPVPLMSVGLERLRRKIKTTLGASAIRDVAVPELHDLNLRRGVCTIAGPLVPGLVTRTIVAFFPLPSRHGKMISLPLGRC